MSLRAIHSASGVRGKSYAARFGAAYCATDYKQVLDDPEVDVVFITSRNQHHAGQALEALRAGKHVFVEKPMALTEAECRDLVQAADESGRQLTVGFNRRFAPFYKPLKLHLAKRSSPAVLQCRINSPGISGSYWMADPSIGGAILGEACHFVDLMYWLLDAEPLSVSAYTLPTGRQDPIGENNMVASFRFADGSIGNLNLLHGGQPDVRRRARRGIRCRASVSKLKISSGSRSPAPFAKPGKRCLPIKGMTRKLTDSLAPCAAERQAPVTVRDGARSSIACLRMLESARELMPKSIDWERVIA